MSKIDVAGSQSAPGVALVPTGLVAAAGPVWQALTNWLFDHYKPEKHYMRGHGPKWHEKHGLPIMGVEDRRRHG